MWFHTVVVSLIFVFPSPAAHGESFSGSVVGVLDGDTIEVLHNNRAERLRLNGIDCPKKGQAYGKQAKQAASELVFDKQVTLKTHGLDKYGRTIADVLLPDGSNVNQQLVKEGWCWWFRKFVPKDQKLKQFEQEAKDAKKGLWADPNPVPPWLYRRLERGLTLSLDKEVSCLLNPSGKSSRRLVTVQSPISSTSSRKRSSSP
jgi:micrococcal nuclease